MSESHSAKSIVDLSFFNVTSASDEKKAQTCLLLYRTRIVHFTRDACYISCSIGRMCGWLQSNRWYLSHVVCYNIKVVKA